MIDHYDWAGGREAMLRFGPDSGPVVIAALPLFEEANRTRAFAVTILRHLADLGIAGALPDLPGQGESEVSLEKYRLNDWQQAFTSAVSHLKCPAHIVSIRSGSLLTRQAVAASRWLLSPHPGDALVRELLWMRQLGEGRSEAGDAFPIDSPGAPLNLGGNHVARATLRDLRDAAPDRTTPSRLVRLTTDADAADRRVEGAPLWRRSEPGNDPALAALLAEDIANWVRRCAN